MSKNDPTTALQFAATSTGVAVELVALDVTSDEFVVEAVARIESAAGRIDVVLCEGGVVGRTPSSVAFPMGLRNSVSGRMPRGQPSGPSPPVCSSGD